MESFGVFSGKGINRSCILLRPRTLSRVASGLIFLYTTIFCLIFFSFFERDIYRLRLDNQFSRLGFPSISESPKAAYLIITVCQHLLSMAPPLAPALAWLRGEVKALYFVYFTNNQSVKVPTAANAMQMLDWAKSCLQANIRYLSLTKHAKNKIMVGAFPRGTAPSRADMAFAPRPGLRMRLLTRWRWLNQMMGYSLRR